MPTAHLPPLATPPGLIGNHTLPTMFDVVLESGPACRAPTARAATAAIRGYRVATLDRGSVPMLGLGRLHRLDPGYEVTFDGALLHGTPTLPTGGVLRFWRLLRPAPGAVTRPPRVLYVTWPFVSRSATGSSYRASSGAGGALAVHGWCICLDVADRVEVEGPFSQVPARWQRELRRQNPQAFPVADLDAPEVPTPVPAPPASALTRVAPGAAGQVLRATGTGAPAWDENFPPLADVAVRTDGPAPDLAPAPVTVGTDATGDLYYNDARGPRRSATALDSRHADAIAEICAEEDAKTLALLRAGGPLRDAKTFALLPDPAAEDAQKRARVREEPPVPDPLRHGGVSVPLSDLGVSSY